MVRLIKRECKIFAGEYSVSPVCSKCGHDRLYEQVPRIIRRLKVCPECGHELGWGSDDKSELKNRGD